MYTEFLAATLEAHGYITEDRIAEAFDRLDGYVKKTKKLLGHHSLFVSPTKNTCNFFLL